MALEKGHDDLVRWLCDTPQDVCIDPGKALFDAVAERMAAHDNSDSWIGAMTRVNGDSLVVRHGTLSFTMYVCVLSL